MSTPQDSTGPWWKFAHAWMMVGLPAIVVVASIATAFVAMSDPDPVLDADYYRKGLEINKTLSDSPTALAPAMQARNHAATGVPEKSAEKPVTEKVGTEKPKQ